MNAYLSEDSIKLLADRIANISLHAMNFGIEDSTESAIRNAARGVLTSFVGEEEKRKDEIMRKSQRLSNLISEAYDLGVKVSTPKSFNTHDEAIEMYEKAIADYVGENDTP